VTRILSTSFTSVSIFSVWCYSSVSISVVDYIPQLGTKDLAFGLSSGKLFPVTSKEVGWNEIRNVFLELQYSSGQSRTHSWCLGYMADSPGLRPRPLPLHAALACPLRGGSRDIWRKNQEAGWGTEEKERRKGCLDAWGEQKRQFYFYQVWLKKFTINVFLFFSSELIFSRKKFLAKTNVDKQKILKYNALKFIISHIYMSIRKLSFLEILKRHLIARGLDSKNN